MRDFARLCVLAWATALSIPEGVAEAQVLIQPVVVELGGRQKVASVTISLSPSAAAPLRLQAEVLSWSQDLNGRAVTDFTDELLVTPPLVEIHPGARQIFRLALRGGRSSNDELAYRLRLEDVSTEIGSAAVGPGMQIRFRTNYDLAVLVSPVGAMTTLLRWKPCSGPPAQAAACVRVMNDSNHRVKVKKLTVVGTGWTETLSLSDDETVLVGTEREWRLPLPGGKEGAPVGVLIETAQGNTLKADDGGF